MLGDFNAGCGYARKEELQGLEISGPDYVWIVPHSADTNLGKEACAYDRIVMDRRGTEDYAGVWEVDRAFTERRISNHWPVWAEFHVEPGRRRLAREKFSGRSKTATAGEDFREASSGSWATRAIGRGSGRGAVQAVRTASWSGLSPTADVSAAAFPRG